MVDYHVLKIGNATIGGAPGARTSLVVGSIFYDKHSIVQDPFAGKFDKDRAAFLLDRVNKLSNIYGIQMALDIIAASPEAMERFLEFASTQTSLPLMINATEADVRITGLKTAARLGILDRIVYSSLNEDTEDAELEALGRYQPAGVMILASDINNPTPEGSCDMIKNYFQPMLKEINVAVPIVDLGTMDPPSIGLNIRQIQAVGERFGYPAGCAFSNCFPQWHSVNRLGREWINLSLGAALVACRAAGAAYLHYGIVEKAAMAAHVASTAEVFYGYAAQELDGQTLPAQHPLKEMFKLTEIPV